MSTIILVLRCRLRKGRNFKSYIDIVLLARTEKEIQKLIYETVNWGKKWGLSFAKHKCKILCVGPKEKGKNSYKNIKIKLHPTDKNNLEILNLEKKGWKYLGIIERDGSIYDEFLNERKKKFDDVKGMVKSVVCTHLKARVSPAVGITLYTSHLRPIIEFGGEVIDPNTEKHENDLEGKQFEMLNAILCFFPTGSSRAVCRILCGLPPIKARWHYRRLTYLWKLATGKNDSIYLASLRFDASMKSQRSWLALTMKIFQLYFQMDGNTDIFEYLNNISKNEWDLRVGKSISEYWHVMDVQNFEKEKSRGKLLSEIYCRTSQPIIHGILK